jgi:uncharacterized DUF497 family protein
MADLRFTWNSAKAAANLKKHGVSFAEARTAFEDERALIIDDPDHSDVEDRFVLLGFSASARLLVVVHCYRTNDETIRLISARRATRTEQRVYQDRGET